MTRLALTLGLTLALCPGAAAQQGPRIAPVVVDLHLTFPKFPGDSVALADSRDIEPTDLPGLGRGLDAAVHVHLLKWRAVTFGVGGNVLIGRSTSTPPQAAAGRPPLGQAVTERYTSIAPQVSLNFGNGYGWSYLSGGIGRSTWSIVPEGATATAADEEKIKTINYGGGARWFKKKHVGFSFDVRFYAINPGTPVGTHTVGSPRTTLLVIGAGVSVK
jgi:hypothetical protein